MGHSRDHYSILGIPRDVSTDVIRRAYLRKARQYHPDLHQGEAIYQAQMSAVNQAYATLSDVVSRTNYDIRLRSPRIYVSEDDLCPTTFGSGGRVGGTDGVRYSVHWRHPRKKEPGIFEVLVKAITRYIWG